MNHDNVVGLSLALTIALAGHPAVAQTNEGAGTDASVESAHVDPELRDRKRCLNHPGRPQWMIDQPLGFEWRLELGREFRSAERARAVSSNETCSCDQLYPDWNESRPLVEAIWAEVSPDSKFVWGEAERDRFDAARDKLADYSRPLLPMVTRLCASVE